MSPVISSSKHRMKTSFRKARVIAPLHTGGPIAVTHDAQKIITCVQEDVLLTDVESGVEICRFQGDTTSITSLCLSPTSNYLVVFFSSNSLRIYQLPLTSEPVLTPVPASRHVPRAHDAPVHVSTIDPTSSCIASGSADGVVKVWDLHRGYITHVFKGHGGVVSALTFHHRPAQEASETSLLQLFTGSIDTRIRVFSLTSTHARAGGRVKPDAILEGHVSVPRGIAVSSDGKWLVSSGRDAVALIWDLKSGEGRSTMPSLVKTLPVLERIEALGILKPEDSDISSKRAHLKFYTGGEQGTIKIWDAWEGAVVTCTTHQQAQDTSEENLEEQRQIVNAFYVPAAHVIVSLHADQNILFHSLKDNTLARQLIGFNDEITDATLLCVDSSTGTDSHLALATNSSLIRIYSVHTHDARLLFGHTGIVLALDKGADGRVLVSGSKDRTARIWAHSDSADLKPNGRWGCVAICEGHTESVGAAAVSRTIPMDASSILQFMFTGSQDRTIKMWDLSSVSPKLQYSLDGDVPEPMRPTSLMTLRAHDKDINSLDVSPNDRYLASGSQDKTAKVFEINHVVSKDGSVRGYIRELGLCKGHKRGVWNVRFGKEERVLATGSGDKTVRLWSLDDFTCLKTFEGHANSVLRVDFVSQGRQLLSAASDGLVKLWDVQKEECLDTMDNHEDKVWALAVGSDESTVVSAGADSVVTFWKDSTVEVELEKEAKREELALREQDFADYVSLNDYRNAIILALTMDHPGRLLSLFRSVRSSAAEDYGLESAKVITGHLAIDQVLKTLPFPSLCRLLTHVRTWNASARTSNVAQMVLHAILKLRPAEDVAAALKGNEEGKKGCINLHEFIESMIPYTERHLVRVENLVQDSWVIDLVLGEMDGGLFEEDDAVEAMNVDKLQS